jgi:hypothetical protein
VVLFPEPAEPRTNPLGWIEPAVHWFTELTRAEASVSRQTVNAWYEKFPDKDGRFAARLRSEDNATFYQALDELHVYNLLRQNNPDVRYEVGGVGPDFRIYLADACVGGVEVLSLFQQQEWTDDELRHLRLADSVCAAIAPTAGYFVDYEIEQADQDPVPRRYIAFLRRELDRLPAHDTLAEELNASRSRDIPTATFRDDGVEIRTRFMPMRRDAPAKTDPDARIVGTGAIIGGTVTTAGRLRERVKAKAGSRYDIDGVPFLVAVGLHDVVGEDYEIINGLYGSEAVDLRSHQAVRRGDGFFGVDATRAAGRRHRRVSGVAVVTGLQVWAPGEEDVALFHNPYAERAWPKYGLPATREFGPVTETSGTIRLDWY